MSTHDRRARERSARHERIVTAARELAEEHGWDAVTTRRLAGRIEYSQPVLYSHFPGGKDEILAAVALAGFAELAAVMRVAVDDRDGRAATAAVTDAYLDFAARRPAVYDAMFARAALPFAGDTPPVLREGFETLREALGGDEVDAEIGWSTLHGLATLAAAGRLSDATTERRHERVVALLTGARR